jgi:hypothetical protein
LTLTQAAHDERLEASASGLASATTASFTVAAAAAMQLVIAPARAGTITAGDGFAVVVSAEDPFGNVDPSFAGQVTLALQSGPPGAAPSGMTTAMATSGVATFVNLAINTTGAGYTLEASSAGVASASTGAFSVGASVPTQLAIFQQPPAGVMAGSGFGLAVVAEDAFGNFDTDFAGSVSLSLSNNSGGPGTALGGTVTVTATTGSGQASFAGLFFDKASADYTLEASSGSLSPATTNPITVSAAAASQLAIIAQPPPIVTAGSGFTLAVAGEDQYGDVDPTFSGSVTLNRVSIPEATALGDTLTSVASAGVASFSNVTLTLAGSDNLLQASNVHLRSTTTVPFTVAAAPATYLALTAAPPGSVVAGDPFGLAVAAQDPFGNVDSSFAGNVAVTLRDNPTGDVLGGTLSAPVHLGVTTFFDLALDRAGTGATLMLASDRLTGVTTGAIAVSPAPAAQLVVTTEPPASLVAGDDFELAVTVEDRFGNTATDYGGVITVASSDGTGALQATSVAGVASFDSVMLDRAGTYRVNATSGGLQAAASTPLMVSAAAAVRLTFLAQPPASVTAGNGFGLVALAQDRFGNTLPSFAGSVTVALGNNPAGDALSGVPSATANNGAALFSDLVLTSAATADTLVVNSGGLDPAATSPFALVAAPATQLAVASQPPSSIIAGTPLGLTVAVEDRFGNEASAYDGSVTLGLATAPAGAAPDGTLTVRVRGGLAAFSDIVLTTAATGVVFQLSSGSLSPAMAAPVTVTAAKATQLIVADQPPSQVTAGNGFGLVAVAEDSYRNPDLAFQGIVALALAGGGALAGPITLMADAGVAAFSNLMLTREGTGQVLQVASSGLVPTTTNPINVLAAGATQLVVTSEPPSSVTAAAPIGLVVEAEDRFGNVDASYQNTIALVLANNPAGDALGGTVSVEADAGVATFSGLILVKAAEGAVLGASSGTLNPATTLPVAVTAAAASQLVVTTPPPPRVTAGNGFGLLVEAEDPFGNLARSFTGPIALTLANAAAGAALAGTPSLHAESGMATFSGLMVNKSGTGDTIEASSADLTDATSGPITVVSAGATQVVIGTQPPSAVAAGRGFELLALAEDDYGNVDPNFAGNVSLTGGSLGGPLTVAATAGVAPFTDVSLTKAAANVVLVVSGSGLRPASSGAITVTAGAADHLVIADGPPAAVIAGNAFGLAVAAEDRFGNVDPSFNAIIVLTPLGNPAGAPLGGTLSVAATGGPAAFGGLTLDGAAAGITIQAASPGLASTLSNAITVTAAAATRLVIAAQRPSSVNAGAGFGLVAQAEDPFANVDPRYAGTVNVALASSSGGARLGGTLGITASSGVATFSGLTLDRGGGRYALALTSQDLAPAATRAVDVISPSAQVVAVSVQKLQLARRKTGTVIDIQFDEPLDAAAAANLAAYLLTTTAPGRQHRSRLLPLARSRYNAMTNTVTLTPLRMLSLSSPVQLRIIASVLIDALGRPLDGNDDGQPGGDFVAPLHKAGVSTASAAGSRFVEPLSTLVVDSSLSDGFRPRGVRARERALP